jgi:hypothetical protein
MTWAHQLVRSKRDNNGSMDTEKMSARDMGVSLFRSVPGFCAHVVVIISRRPAGWHCVRVGGDGVIDKRDYY